MLEVDSTFERTHPMKTPESSEQHINLEAERNTAWRISYVGWPMLFAYMAVIAGFAIWQPKPYAWGGYLVVSNLFIGRAYNISQGLLWEFDRLYLLFQCGLEDIIVLMVIYPWLVVAYSRAAQWRYIGPFFRDIRESAESHRKRVDWLGPLGLVMFVFFPFWSTGPLVGGMIGYLMGLRPWLLFSSVFLGNMLSVIVGIYAFETVHRFDETLGARLPAIIFLFVVGLLAAGYITARRKNAAKSTTDSDA